MKNGQKKYWLVFHSRAEEAVGAGERYARFFERIRGLPAPWGGGERAVPPAPEFGRLISASVGLTKFFGDGVGRAVMTFVYRRLLDDRGSSDDLLTITLDPDKVDVRGLINEVIPRYVEAFDAYLVEWFDERFIAAAWETREEEGRVVLTAKSKTAVNPRFQVGRVGVVSFFDGQLCRRAFSLSPAEVLERLRGKIEHGCLIRDGVYLVGTSQILPFDEARKLCAEMKAPLSS